MSIYSEIVGDWFSLWCAGKGGNWDLYGETLGARVCVSFMCWDFITMGNVLFLISVLAGHCQQPPLHTLAQTILLWFLINHYYSAPLCFSQLEHSGAMGQRCDDAFCSTTQTVPFQSVWWLWVWRSSGQMAQKNHVAPTAQRCNYLLWVNTVCKDMSSVCLWWTHVS